MGTPPSSAHCRRWRSLAARSTTGPLVRPVSRPASTSSRFAATWSIPSSAASGSTISAKPPDTSPTFAPAACTVSMSSRAPGDSSTASRTAAITGSASRPASVATRSRREAAKSSSPRIARSVMSATSSRAPACSASSSMTSAVMRVESTSITSSPTPSATSSPAVTALSTARAVAGPRSSAARRAAPSTASVRSSRPEAAPSGPAQLAPSWRAVTETANQPGREVSSTSGEGEPGGAASSPRACSTRLGGNGRAETRPIRTRVTATPYGAGGRRRRGCSAGDVHALGDHRDAGLGDREATLAVTFGVHALVGAVVNPHVLVHDRPLDDGVAADVDVLEDHRVTHRGPGVDLGGRGDHRAHHLAAGDDDALGDEGVQGVPQALPVPVDELGRRVARVAGEQRPLVVVEVEHRAHRDERSEEHTSELQSRGHLVCRLLLEKKKNRILNTIFRSSISTMLKKFIII